MAKKILMDELHVTVLAPAGLPEPEYRAIHAALNSRRFAGELRRAVQDVLGRFRGLSKTTVKVSR